MGRLHAGGQTIVLVTLTSVAALGMEATFRRSGRPSAPPAAFGPGIDIGGERVPAGPAAADQERSALRSLLARPAGRPTG